MDINNKFFEQVYVVMLLPLVCSVCGWLGNFLLAFSFFHLLRVLFTLNLFWVLVAFLLLIKMVFYQYKRLEHGEKRRKKQLQR